MMKAKLKALGIYQICGGALGIALTLYMFAGLIAIPGIWYLLIFIAFVLFGYSIFCGIILLKQVKKGLFYSQINQILQLFQFAVLGYAYLYVSGINLSVGLDLTRTFNLKAALNLSSWQFNVNAYDPDITISINLVALYLVAWINKTKATIRKEEVSKQLEILGQQEEAKSVQS
jgi:hypothetical protein